MSSLKGIALLGIGLFALSGCGNPNVDRLGGGGGEIVWPEHEALFSPEQFGGVDMGLEMGDARSAMGHAASPEYKAAVTEFKNSEVPNVISDRTAERDQVVVALESMITAAEGNNATEFRTAVEETKQANRELMAMDVAEE